MTLCACGCGQPTSIAMKTRRGNTKGEPTRFLNGHTSRAHRPLADRLWEKVVKTDGCWLYAGTTDDEGYGLVCVDRTHRIAAHRAAWQVTNGPIPDGMDVLHRCDNRPCVRPDHLFLGDQVANNADMVAKGRHRAPQGAAHWMARLGESQVAEIRASYVPHGPRDGSTRRTREALAATFGISVGHVIAIQLGAAWAHLERGAA